MSIKTGYLFQGKRKEPQFKALLNMPFAYENAEANAAFIVRACNNHAKLLEVLKEAYACLGVLEYAPGRLLGKMDKAIREAEE